MNKDLVNFSGKLISPAEMTGPDSLLLGADFIYQRVHVLAGQPLHVEGHSEILTRAQRALYGNTLKLSAEKMTKEICFLVEANRYTNCSVIINVFIYPPEKGKNEPPQWMISHSRQLLYKGYTLWHTPLKATITRYEYPFAEFPTAVAFAAHTYAMGHARRRGADVTLTQNHHGIITGAGPYPFFAISRDRIFTTPLEDGALDSIERRLGLEAARKAGFEIEEQPLEAESLADHEEFFIVTGQGVASIGSIKDRLYPTSAAKVVAEAMSGLTGFSLLTDDKSQL